MNASSTLSAKPSVNGLWGGGMRIGLLLVLAAWLIWPYLGGAIIGGGDALWYHHQVADAVTQARAGVFPLFVGQSDYAFNGAVHPLRSAPLLPHLAIVLDTLSGRSLSYSEVTNFAVAGMLLISALSAYAALCWLDPRQRWRAAGLAWAYLACPGVVGLAYAQDLYMSVMALPWLPWAFAASLQMGRHQRRSVPWVLGAAGGLLWWAHAPIALWCLASLALMQGVIGLASLGDRVLLRAWLGECSRTAVGFIGVAAYPLVSVISLREGGESIVTVAMERAKIFQEVAAAGPWLIRPLSLPMPLLAHIQPGYVLLLCLAGAALLAVVGLGSDRLRLTAVTVPAAVLLLFIFPVPGVTRWLWDYIPEFWAGITNYWPNQRIVPIVAAMAVVAWHEGARGLPIPGRFKHIIWLVALAWVSVEASAIRDVGVRHRRPDPETLSLLRPENTNVSAYCYQQLPKRPASFIHGVTSAEMEMRWRNVAGNVAITSNRTAVERAASEPWAALAFLPTGNPGLFVSRERWNLEPGKRYLLSFDFTHTDVRGILRLMGSTLSRVYVLPEAGDRAAFGVLPGQDRSIAVWTTQSEAEQFSIEFIPNSEAGDSPSLPDFARVRLITIDRESLPVQVDDMIPLTLRVRTLGAIQLDTPRMYIPGYEATLNGKPTLVTRSPEGLVSVPVPAGGGRLVVSYRGSPVLRIAFWLSLSAAAASVALLVFCSWSARPSRQ